MKYKDTHNPIIRGVGYQRLGEPRNGAYMSVNEIIIWADGKVELTENVGGVTTTIHNGKVKKFRKKGFRAEPPVCLVPDAELKVTHTIKNAWAMWDNRIRIDWN